MPISSQTPIVGYVANGVSKTFAFPFVILAAEDLKVSVAGSLVTTGFSIAGVGDRSGGAVTFSAAPAASAAIIIYREVSLERTTDYQENGDLLARVLDDDFDRVWMALQDQLLLASRALRAPLGETLQQLPPASERALMALAFDAAGNPIVVRGTNDGGAALALDLLNTAQGKGAVLVGVNDSADNYTGANVEDVLAEIALRSYCVQLERFRSLNSTVAGEERWDNAFDAAMTAALASNKPIYLGCNPVIKYFSNTWNCSANDNSKDGLMIFGAGSLKSKPYWRNTSGACIEVQGVDALHLKDFQIAGDCTVGIAGGRSTVRQWNGNHWYENLRIIMPDDMTKNGGIGTIALLGIEPEESTYSNCEFWANLPVIICPPNNISVKTFDTAGVLTTARSITWAPTYTPIISTFLSNTVFHFSNGCRMVAHQPDSPPVALRSASSVFLGDSFLQIRGGGENPSGDVKKCPYAIDADNTWNVQWWGTGERATDDTKTDVGALLLSGSAENWTISANAGTASSTTANKVPAIYVVNSVGGVHRNNDIKLRLNSFGGQYPFGFSSASGSGIKVENSRYEIGTTAGLGTIPQPLLFNMSGSTIKLVGANATVPVLLEKVNRYSQKLSAGKDLPSATAVTVATAVLPTTGMSSGTLQFRNVVLNAGFINSDGQTAILTGEFDVTWCRDSGATTLTVTTTRSSWSASVKTNAGQLDIAAPTITLTPSGAASFEVKLTANLSGAVADGKSTRFDADLVAVASLGTNGFTARVTTQ